MCQIAFDITNEVLYDTRMTESEALSFARKTVAMNYYIKHGISLSYCTQIAGMSKEAFIRYLGVNGVSIFQFDNTAEFQKNIRINKSI